MALILTFMYTQYYWMGKLIISVCMTSYLFVEETEHMHIISNLVLVNLMTG